MLIPGRSVTSIQKMLRACVEAQQPTHKEPLKSHFITPSVAAVGAIDKGRVRATPATAPKALPVNRQTVRQQDNDDKYRQWVMTVNASADSKSLSPSSRQVPHRRT